MVVEDFKEQGYPADKLLRITGLARSSYYYKSTGSKAGKRKSSYFYKDGMAVNKEILLEDIKELLLGEFVDYGYFKTYKYLKEEVIEMDNGELFYFLEEKPKNSMWRVHYNANRFVPLPEGKEPHEIKLPDYQKLTEEEDFIRKMKRLKMPDETIQHFLNSFQKEK